MINDHTRYVLVHDTARGQIRLVYRGLTYYRAFRAPGQGYWLIEMREPNARFTNIGTPDSRVQAIEQLTRIMNEENEQLAEEDMA